MEFRPFETFTAFLLVVFVKADINPDSKCIEYNSESFAENVNKNDHFVMFFAPWCVHCKKLHPTWDELAELLNDGEGSRVTVARVDCTKESTICKEQDITGYPTLKYFSTKNLEPVKFRGIRDLPALTNFVNVQLGSNLVMHDDRDEQPRGGAVPLNDDNYQNRLSSGKHFVKFYAPWCGHCQRLAPIWDTLGIAFEDSQDITISKIDCTLNKEACDDYEIKSYPTLLMIENGQLIGKYQGQKTLINLKEYIKNHLGGSDDSLDIEYDPITSDVQPLTGSGHFKNTISGGFTFVKFFAPWCGHCKGLAPTWEDLGKKFRDKAHLAIAKVDCTIDVNKDLCNEQNIDGFPTLYLYKNGEKVEEYTGGRSLEELTDFVVRHTEHHDHEHIEL